MIVRTGPRRFELRSRSTGRVLGTHPTRRAAERQEAAIHAHSHARRNPADPSARCADPRDPAVGARLYEPEAPNDEAVRAVVGPDARRGGAPAQVWETLAVRGAIPLAWADGREPRFVASSRGLLDDPVAAPPTRRAAAALARDPAGVAAAEELARVAFRRMLPFAPARVDAELQHVLWVTGPLPPPRELGWRRAPALRLLSVATRAQRVLERDARAFGVPWSDAQSWRSWWWDMTRRGAAVFDRLAALDAAITWVRGAERGSEPRAVGVRYADLANPFDPLLGIWCLGYAPLVFTFGANDTSPPGVTGPVAFLFARDA